VLLVPLDHPMADQLGLLGRTMGALLTDNTFSKVAFFAEDVHALSCGIDLFLKHVVCIPPAKWHTDLTLEPNDKIDEVSYTICLMTH